MKKYFGNAILVLSMFSILGLFSLSAPVHLDNHSLIKQDADQIGG